MRTRPLTALVAALALLAAVPAASRAQDPSPTPTATPTAESSQGGSAAEAPDDASKEVKAVYKDYSDHGKIDVCAHARDDLQETLDTIEPAFDRDFPDFREALTTGIKRHDDGRCDDDSSSDDGTTGGTGTTTDPTPTATAGTDTGDTTPESGALPEADTGATDDGGSAGALPPPEDGSLPPDDGSAAPEDGALPPPVTTPAPALPPVPAAQAAASPTPVVVTRSGSAGLLVPGVLIGIAVLGAGVLAVSTRGGSPQMRGAWREAAFRTRSTWADFADWLRLGR